MKDSAEIPNCVVEFLSEIWVDRGRSSIRRSRQLVNRCDELLLKGNRNDFIWFSRHHIWQWTWVRVCDTCETPAVKIVRNRDIAYSFILNHGDQSGTDCNGARPCQAQIKHAQLLVYPADGRLRSCQRLMPIKAGLFERLCWYGTDALRNDVSQLSRHDRIVILKFAETRLVGWFACPSEYTVSIVRYRNAIIWTHIRSTGTLRLYWVFRVFFS